MQAPQAAQAADIQTDRAPALCTRPEYVPGCACADSPQLPLCAERGQCQQLPLQAREHVLIKLDVPRDDDSVATLIGYEDLPAMEAPVGIVLLVANKDTRLCPGGKCALAMLFGNNDMRAAS
eukprot:350148-Chlamydomonas_euryale.AAC.2